MARSPARHRTLVFLLVAVVALGSALRLWRLGATEFVFDEAFTAVVARLPLHKLFPYLRAHDAHPPFDYLVRRPLALAGASELVLRLPSVAFSVAALVAFATWMRRRALLAIIATAVMAVSAFQITYGQQARMYACMVAVGVGCAWAASAWLTRPGAWPCVAVGLVLLVGLFDHVSSLFLAAGLVLVPGMRRDRWAWWWRASVAGTVAVWAALWGPALLDQAHHPGDTWVPYTTVGYLVRTLSELFGSSQSVAVLAVPLVLLGCVLAGRRSSQLARVMIVCAAVPSALVAIVGIHTHALLPRTLAFASWVPAVGFATLVTEAVRRRDAFWGVAVATVVGVLVVPSTLSALRKPDRRWEAMHFVRREAGVHDVVAVNPSWLWPRTHWYLGVRRPGVERPFAVPGLAADGLLLGSGTWNGRVWLLEPRAYNAGSAGFRDCAPVVELGGWRVRCLAKDAS